MVHVFTAVGAEAGDDGTERAFSISAMSACIRTPDELRRFGSISFSSLANLAERAAHADGLIDGGSGASAKTAQYHTPRAEGVLYGTAAGTARALRHSNFISQVAVAANADTIEPRRVEVLAGLHMESDRDGIFIAEGIGRGPAAVAATEVDGHALARHANEVAITVTVAIPIAVLGRGDRGKRNQTQNRDKKEWSRLRHRPSQESNRVLPLSAN